MAEGIKYSLTRAEKRNINPEVSKGYYTLGFTTKIKKATKKDVDLSEDYGIYLVGKFHKILPKLLYLELKETNSTVSSVDTVHYVKMGQLYLGKLSISYQQYPTYTNILYVYRNKNTSINFKKQVLGKKHTLSTAMKSGYSDYKKRHSNMTKQRKYHED